MCIICTTLFIYCLCISDFALLQHSINFQPFSEVLSAQYMRDGQALLLTIAPGLALHWQKWECLRCFYCAHHHGSKVPDIYFRYE